MLGLPGRDESAKGHVRLLVGMAEGKPIAMLYRPVAAGAKSPLPSGSAWWTITVDRVDDIGDRVQLAGGRGNNELSTPPR